jgi:RimJ/RimL family protein N-acetyltransferase
MTQLEPKPLQIRLRGRSLILREATIADAAFIVALRSNPLLSKFIHSTHPSIMEQEKWLADYALRPDDYYLICEDAHGEPWGTVRVPSVQGLEFGVGSWVFLPDAPPGAAVQAILLAFRFGFDRLGCDLAVFDVRRGNEHVWRFHEACGARRTGEDAENFFYSLDKAAFLRAWLRQSSIVACPDPSDWLQEVHRAERLQTH